MIGGLYTPSAALLRRAAFFDVSSLNLAVPHGVPPLFLSKTISACKNILDAMHHFACIPTIGMA
jgi:hypothetical protein